MLDWGRSTLLVTNVQYDFCARDGFAAKIGRNIEPLEQILSPLKSFVRKLRGADLPIIFLQYVARKDLSPDNIRINKDREEKARMCLLDSRGSALYSVLPKNQDSVIRHRYYDAFADSELKSALKKLQTRTVLIAGVRSELSVFATAQRAISEGYEVVLLADLIATYPEKQPLERHLWRLFDRYYGYVKQSAEILEEIS